MSDDLDIEALLEAPYQKKEQETRKDDSGADGGSNKENQRENSIRKRRSRSRSRRRSRDRSRHRRKSRSRRRSHSRHKRRSHSRGRRSPDRRRRSPSRGRSRHSRSRERKSRKERSRERSRDRSRPRRPRSRSRQRRASPLPPKSSRSPVDDFVSAEERDQRTVFCMQLSNRVKSRDLEEFFSSVGRVRDVKLIMDTKTRRSKGIAYIEFASVESVPLALALNGQKLLGVPIIVQPTQAEKNRAAATMLSLQKYTTVTGPMKLYVGNLHPNITKEMLKGIFDPFGKVENIEIVVDELGISKGYGYVSFYEVEDAKRALEQMNGFLLAEMELKVSHVTSDKQQPGPTNMLDADELERSGIDLGVTGRLQLMAKLAEGTGLQVPSSAAVHLPSAPAAPPIATQSFLLSNMFDPGCSTDQTYLDIYTEVVKECRPLGGALHVFVDKASQQGNVYVKCASVNATQLAVQYFHGRWVQGRLINAAYVTTENYHQLFPETAYLTTVL